LSERTGEDVPDGNAWKQPALYIKRGPMPINDYEDGPKALYDGFWDIFPTRCGLGKGTLRMGTFRRIFLYHDNRGARDMPLLFCSASTLQRHATNSCVKAQVRVNKDRFEEFVAEVNDPTFYRGMQVVKANPTTKKAQAWLRRMHRYLQLSASKVSPAVGGRPTTAVDAAVAGTVG
jgi:hypothetical protein